MAARRARAIASALAVMAGTVAGTLWRVVSSATLWAVIFLAGGGVLIYLGVLENWGRGYALLCAGMMLALTGVVLVRGLTRGG